MDPYPKQLVLTRTNLAVLLDVSVPDVVEVIATEGFPKSITLGKERNGKPRLRWDKAEVYAWIARQ